MTDATRVQEALDDLDSAQESVAIELRRADRLRREAEAERDRYAEALREITDDVGHPGDPAWRVAMEALGLDAAAAERAWHD